MPGSTVTPEGVLALDADAVRRWAVLVRAAYASRRAEIDALNVFPVPDGDTGTNLFLTFDGALDRDQTPAVSDAGPGGAPGVGDLLDSFASSLLWAARGNSGVILSQLARGIAEAARGHDSMDAATLALALQRADEMAWKAVTDPKEGTILSVSRAAAQAAHGAVSGGLHAVASAALTAACDALDRTTDQLEVLARAGVVDAGGLGYVVLLECLERVCAGDADGDETDQWTAGRRQRRHRRWAADPSRTALSGGADDLADTRRPTDEHLGSSDDGGGAIEAAGPQYEVMFLLAESSDEAIERLRHRLVELGDSVLVVGGDGEWNVHAHVDDPGAAVEAGIEVGRPHRVRITRLEHVHPEPGPGHRHGEGGGHDDDPDAVPRPPGVPARGRSGRPAGTASGIVACAVGRGLVAIFAEAGASVVESGPSRRASTGQLIEAVREQHAAGAGAVVVLPNDGDTELAAGAAIRVVADEGIEAHLVRARTPVQAVAAMAVFDDAAPAATNVLAMQSAASATRHGAVSLATRSALTSAGPCEPGDVLGIVDGDIVVIGSDQAVVGREIVHRLLASGGELLTVVVGADAPAGLADAVTAEAGGQHAGLDVSVIDGGQPVYTVLLGVE